MKEDKRDERLAGWMTGMLRDEAPGGVLRLAPDQQLRRRWPLAMAAAAAATLLALLAIGAVVYRLAHSYGAVDHLARPVVQPVPGAAPTPMPKAYVAVAPPPPPSHPVVRRRVHRHEVRRFFRHPMRAPMRAPFREPDEEEFVPAERAYGPYFAVPLGREALRRVLIEDRRRTRELNDRELDNLPEP